MKMKKSVILKSRCKFVTLRNVVTDGRTNRILINIQYILFYASKTF